jgi:hypothetical protein
MSHLNPAFFFPPFLSILLPSPDAHQPLHCGPASFLPPGTTQQQLWTMPNRPAPSTKPTRHNTVGSLMQTLGQPWVPGTLAPGHDQAEFDPQNGVASLRAGAAANMVVQRRARQQQQQQNNPLVVPGIKLLIIGGNECFARAAFHFLAQIEVLCITKLCTTMYCIALELPSAG